MNESPVVPPGWYPDTSNPGYQRYWDGSAWTEHVAPTGAAPAPGRWTRRIVWTAVGVAVIVIATVVVALVVDDSAEVRDARTSPTTATSPSPSQSRAARSLDLAQTVTVRPSDLPATWTECCPPDIYGPAPLQEHICGSPAGLPPREAGYTRSYALNLRENGLEDAHLVATAIVSHDVDAAAREYSGVDAEDYQACALPSTEDANLAGRAVVGEPETTFVGRTALDVNHPAILDRYVTRFQMADGPHDIYAGLVRLMVGRVLVRLHLQQYASPMSESEIEAVVRKVADRAQRVQKR